ncbi:unnamed protein product [Trifolium pratense]|uniref:Uncharacterized protein n=1 Tax=Trifolium pratense TaxID=57577 RepID=A0ACB0L7Z3_TRIPR|nr:unnamed protein product [Trifolium pratense]
MRSSNLNPVIFFSHIKLHVSFSSKIRVVFKLAHPNWNHQYQSPPILKPPTPPPLVKSPPYQSPPIVKPPTPVAPTTPTPIVKSWKDCIPLCDNRCKLHSRKKLCARACMTCCDRCKCVPPGTYGNREKCGKCYTDMLTHGNKFKCP